MAENVLFQEYGVQDYIDIAKQAAAIKVATDISARPEAKGKTIVAICADNAFKYLSTNIYK